MTTHRKRAVIVGVLSIIATAFLFIGEAVYKPILSLAQPQEAAELETFIDGLMTAQLEEYQIPGSVVVVVQDGEVSLAKGYGYANVERQLKVDPETSMFRIASISKLFIYTAVMQLVEEGKLELDTPIVDYLSSAGMSTEGIAERTTIKHLMTHTAGFEYVMSGSYSRDAEDMRPLGAIIIEQLPAQIRPPGTLAAYSNSGIGLLGLIVEIASGMTWTDYIGAHILEPLDMTHTTGRQPVPDDLVESLVTGYRLAGGDQQAQDFIFVPLGPAGGMSASGLDMAQFMLAHLQEGEGILEPETTRTMHTTLFQHDPRLPGMAYGFFESQHGGQHIIGHSGTLPNNFISDMWLVPEHDLGIFLSYNSGRGMMAQIAFAKAFFDHYFPHALAPSLSLEAEELSHLTGTYRSTLINLTTPEKFNNLTQSMIVNLGDNGNLQLFSLVMPPMEVEPLGEGLFRDINTGERVVIAERDGLRHVFVENWPDHAFIEIAWYETPQFHVLLLLVALLVFLSVIIASARSAYVRRRLEETPKAFERWARITALVMSLLFFAFIIAQVVSTIVGTLFGLPAYLTVINTVLPVAVILAFVTVIFAVLAWSRRTWGLGARLHYSLVALVGLSLVGQLTYFNLLTVPW